MNDSRQDETDVYFVSDPAHGNFHDDRGFLACTAGYCVTDVSLSPLIDKHYWSDPDTCSYGPVAATAGMLLDHDHDHDHDHDQEKVHVDDKMTENKVVCVHVVPGLHKTEIGWQNEDDSMGIDFEEKPDHICSQELPVFA